MSLDWNISECENWEDLPKGTTECMVFMSMFVGINRITDLNWKEFAKRMHMWEAVNGPIRSDGENMDPMVVRDYVGLWTNASTLTLTQYNKRLGETLRRKAGEAFDRAQP
jgi:hypothetical protein